MKFCFLNEAFKGNSYIPGDQPNEKPYGPFTAMTYESAAAGVIPEEVPQKSMLCNNVFEHVNSCHICKKRIDDIIEVSVRERLLGVEKEDTAKPDNTVIIILFIILIWWIFSR